MVLQVLGGRPDPQDCIFVCRVSQSHVSCFLCTTNQISTARPFRRSEIEQVQQVENQLWVSVALYYLGGNLLDEDYIVRSDISHHVLCRRPTVHRAAFHPMIYRQGIDIPRLCQVDERRNHCDERRNQWNKQQT